MDFSTLKNISPVYPMYISQFKDIISDPNSDIQTKINSIIDNLNAYGATSNQLVNNWNQVMQWALNDGLNSAVVTQMNAIVADGQFQTTLDNIVSKEGDLTKLTTNVKTDLTSAINEVVTELNDIVIDIKSPKFGAKGDGLTDDAQAIQNAVNYLQTIYDVSNPNNNIGYKILFPSGKYLIKSSITFKSPITFEGVSFGATYIVGDSSLVSSMFVCQDSTSSIRFSFHKIRFTGIPAGYAAIDSLNSYSVDAEIRSCWFDNYGTTTSIGINGQFGDVTIEGSIFENLGTGIYGQTHFNTIRISNNEFYSMQGHSIHLEGVVSPNQWQTKEVSIVGNTFDFNKGGSTSAIYLRNYHLGSIIGNTVNNGESANSSPTYFIDRFCYLESCYDFTITGNTIQGVNAHVVYLTSSNHCVISNNIGRTNSNSVNSVNAIELNNSNDNTIIGNNFYDFGKQSTSQGILLGSSNDNVVIGNTINDTNWGIRETGTSTGNVVKNNHILQNVVTPYALITADNDDRLGQIVVRDSTVDYGLNLNDVEIQTYTTNLTAFHTISLPSAPKGFKFSIIRSDTGTSTLQIYDNMGAVSLVTINNKTGVDLSSDGTKWNIIRQYTVQ